MSYVIDAWLDEGNPCLEIRDAETRELRFHWSQNRENLQQGMHELFKGLLLISCACRLSLAEKSAQLSFGEECTDCEACTGELYHAQTTLEYLTKHQ